MTACASFGAFEVNASSCVNRKYLHNDRRCVMNLSLLIPSKNSSSIAWILSDCVYGYHVPQTRVHRF